MRRPSTSSLAVAGLAIIVVVGVFWGRRPTAEPKPIPESIGISVRALALRHAVDASVNDAGASALRAIPDTAGRIKGPAVAVEGPSGRPNGPRLADLERKVAEGGPEAHAAASELARRLEAAGESARATEVLATAVELSKAAGGDRSAQHVAALLDQAEFEIRMGRLERALGMLDQALEPQPEDAAVRRRALYARASALRRLGRTRDALTAAEKAAPAGEELPDDPHWVDLHGALLVETGKLEEALDHYGRAQARDEEAAEPSPLPGVRFGVGRAEALIDLGRYEEALEPLEKALEAASAPDADGSMASLRPRVEFALAQALRGTGGDEARARALATAAREAWSSREDQLALDRLGRIEAFLAE